MLIMERIVGPLWTLKKPESNLHCLQYIVTTEIRIQVPAGLSWQACGKGARVMELILGFIGFRVTDISP